MVCDDGNYCIFNDYCNVLGFCISIVYQCFDIGVMFMGTEGRIVVKVDLNSESLIVYILLGVCDVVCDVGSEDTFDGGYYGCYYVFDCFFVVSNVCDDNCIGVFVEYDMMVWNDENWAGGYFFIVNDIIYFKICMYIVDGVNVGKLCGIGLKEYNVGAEFVNSSDYCVCSEYDVCGGSGDFGCCLKNHYSSNVKCGNLFYIRFWGIIIFLC